MARCWLQWGGKDWHGKVAAQGRPQRERWEGTGLHCHHLGCRVPCSKTATCQMALQDPTVWLQSLFGASSGLRPIPTCSYSKPQLLAVSPFPPPSPVAPESPCFAHATTSAHAVAKALAVSGPRLHPREWKLPLPEAITGPLAVSH